MPDTPVPSALHAQARPVPPYLATAIAEYFREPDSFLGLLALNMSMGQWLCVPMVLAGAWLMARSSRAPALP